MRIGENYPLQHTTGGTLWIAQPVLITRRATHWRCVYYFKEIKTKHATSLK